jgi:hypothetical protein
VAFVATLDTDSDGDEIFDTGVYLWERGAIRLVARTGTVVPGEGIVYQIQPPSLLGLSRSVGGALVNARGEVLFQATLTDVQMPPELRGVLLIATPPETFPEITALAPSPLSIMAGATETVVISGSGLEGATDVLVLPPDGVSTLIEASTDGSVTVRITVAAGTASGERQLAVLTGSVASNTLPFQVTVGPPHIDSVLPSAAGPGVSPFIFIGGTNLSDVFDVRVLPADGITISDVGFTDFRGFEEVFARVTVAVDAAPGPRQLVVVSPAGTSNALRFDVSP